MKILLLGGTGAMGTHLKEILVDSGNDVYITSRKQHEGGEPLKYLQGNAHDIDFLSLVLQKDWDAIVDFMVYSTQEFKQRVDMLLNSTKQYIFISSSRVYANSDTPITENSSRLLDCTIDKSFLASDEYSLKKAREEDILTDHLKKNYTIIRPYITYSEQRLQLEDLEIQQWLPRALDGRSIVLSEDMADHFTTLTYGRDVAKGISALIGNERAIGETFHITCGESIRWRDVLSIYSDAIEESTGIRPKVRWIKESLKLNRKESKYQVLYDRLYDRIFDNSKILSLVPSLSFTSPKEGLKKCVMSFIKSGAAKHFSAGTEAVMDRITGERMSISSFDSHSQLFNYLMYRYLCVDRFKKIIQQKYGK